jgi:hypothetical protein
MTDQAVTAHPSGNGLRVSRLSTVRGEYITVPDVQIGDNIRITDLHGRVVFSANITRECSMVALPDLSAETYVISHRREGKVLDKITTSNIGMKK